jgi:hypothetical protein
MNTPLTPSAGMWSVTDGLASNLLHLEKLVSVARL